MLNSLQRAFFDAPPVYTSNLLKKFSPLKSGQPLYSGHNCWSQFSLQLKGSPVLQYMYFACTQNMYLRTVYEFCFENCIRTYRAGATGQAGQALA